MMKYHLDWPDVLQIVESFYVKLKVWKEFNFKDNNVLFYQIIEKKISFVKEYLGIIEANPTITLDDLAALVDKRLEEQERAMDKSNNVFESHKTFNNVRILGWIKYLIIEKDGRVPQADYQKPDCRTRSNKDTQALMSF